MAPIEGVCDVYRAGVDRGRRVKVEAKGLGADPSKRDLPFQSAGTAGSASSAARTSPIGTKKGERK